MKKLATLALGTIALTSLVVTGLVGTASAKKAKLTTVTSVSPQHGPTRWRDIRCHPG